MTKQTFFEELSLLLKELPLQEREQALTYYGEIIADSMEDGLSEEKAVERLGDIHAVAKSILAEHPGSFPILKNKSTGRKTFNIVLLVLGFPIWGALLLTLIVLLLVAYILLYVPIIVLGSLVIAFFGVGLWGIIGSPFLMADVFPMGIIQLGGGLACIGLSILCAIAFYYSLKGILKATKWLWRKSIKVFHKKETGAV